MKNSYFRGGLIFAVSITILNFILLTSLGDSLMIDNIYYAVLTGILAGVLFWLIIKVFVTKTQKKLSIEMEQGEIQLKAGPANHFAGIEAVGGKLTLTNRRLIFKSHRFNIQNHITVIPLTDIRSITRVKTMKLISNGLLVESANGQNDRFVVNSPGEWIMKIEIAMKKSLETG